MSVKIEIHAETAVEAAVELREFYELLSGGSASGAGSEPDRSQAGAEPAVVEDDVENGAVRREEPSAPPAPPEKPAKKRGRPAKAKEPEPEAPKEEEPEPLIRTDPEDREEPEVEDVEDVEDEEAPATRDDLREAMKAYAEKFGMAQAQTELPKLLGHPKISDVPDEEITGAVARVREAAA